MRVLSLPLGLTSFLGQRTMRTIFEVAGLAWAVSCAQSCSAPDFRSPGRSSKDLDLFSPSARPAGADVRLSPPQITHLADGSFSVPVNLDHCSWTVERVLNRLSTDGTGPDGGRLPRSSSLPVYVHPSTDPVCRSLQGAY